MAHAAAWGLALVVDETLLGIALLAGGRWACLG